MLCRSSMAHVFTLCDWQVSAYSKAGIATCVHLRRGKTSIAFDIGTAPERAAGASHVFVSHGHTDHIAAIFGHARVRSLGTAGPATYYVPEYCLDPLTRAKLAF